MELIEFFSEIENIKTKKENYVNNTLKIHQNQIPVKSLDRFFSKFFYHNFIKEIYNSFYIIKRPGIEITYDGENFNSKSKIKYNEINIIKNEFRSQVHKNKRVKKMKKELLPFLTKKSINRLFNGWNIKTTKVKDILNKYKILKIKS